MSKIKPELTSKLFMLLDCQDKGAVSEVEYFNVMRPWASFSATDINNDNELDSAELKTLIWLVDNREPTEARVQRDLQLIDADLSGTIDRLEYIQYLATPGVGEGGRAHFDSSLKHQFDQFDEDKDGL